MKSCSETTHEVFEYLFQVTPPDYLLFVTARHPTIDIDLNFNNVNRLTDFFWNNKIYSVAVLSMEKNISLFCKNFWVKILKNFNFGEKISVSAASLLEDMPYGHRYKRQIWNEIDSTIKEIEKIRKKLEKATKQSNKSLAMGSSIEIMRNKLHFQVSCEKLLNFDLNECIAAMFHECDQNGNPTRANRRSSSNGPGLKRPSSVAYPQRRSSVSPSRRSEQFSSNQVNKVSKKSDIMKRSSPVKRPSPIKRPPSVKRPSSVGPSSVKRPSSVSPSSRRSSTNTVLKSTPKSANRRRQASSTGTKTSVTPGVITDKKDNILSPLGVTPPGVIKKNISPEINIQSDENSDGIENSVNQINQILTNNKKSFENIKKSLNKQGTTNRITDTNHNNTVKFPVNQNTKIDPKSATVKLMEFNK
eukprot:GHVL01034754.1.p1 GENE.GHVL01034754.1~~GHVL01034754.1.p1  ORF type:complete len:416 (+),score=123.54 GHVL01034754.1:228-1475(+)